MHAVKLIADNHPYLKKPVTLIRGEINAEATAARLRFLGFTVRFCCPEETDERICSVCGRPT